MNSLFANDQSAMALMLDAFRAGKDYEGIRNEMKKDKIYAAGKEDQFLFPDEDRYQKEIGDLVTYPLLYDPKVTRNGQPFNIDER